MEEVAQEDQQRPPKIWVGVDDVPVIKLTDFTVTLDENSEITLFLGQASPPIVPASTPVGTEFQAEQINVRTAARFTVPVEFLLAVGRVGEQIQKVLKERQETSDAEG